MDDHKPKNHERDHELDEMLSSLRDDVEPSAEQLSRWANISSKALTMPRKRIQKWRKPVEWAVAASIGFLIAMGVSRLREGSVSCTTPIDVAENSDVDATQLRIFAK